MTLRCHPVWKIGHTIPDGLNNLMDTGMTVEQTPPEHLSRRERAREAATLIATAIARLHSTLPGDSAVPLGFSAPERLHTNPSQPGV